MKRFKFSNILVFALTVTVSLVSMADLKNASDRSAANTILRTVRRPTMATHFGLESARTVLIRFQVKSSATVASA
jgi:hypothetical protein